MFVVLSLIACNCRPFYCTATELIFFFGRNPGIEHFLVCSDHCRTKHNSQTFVLLVFGFSTKTRSDLYYIMGHIQILHLQVGYIPHFLSTYFIKTYIKLYQNFFLNYRMGIKTVVLNVGCRQFIFIHKAHLHLLI
jgi:hypothetical protein